MVNKNPMASKLPSQNYQHDLLLSDEEFLRDFFENSPIGFHVFGPDKIIQAINQAELNMLGYLREEIIGRKKWSDLIIPQQRAQFEQHWKDILKVGRVIDLRYTLRTKTGGSIDVMLNASARFSPSGNLLNTRGTVLEISHFNKAYQALQNSVISLKQQKQLLEQQNQALNVLLANLEIEKQTLKNNVNANLEKLILPLLKKLKHRSNTSDEQYLELLEKNFLGLTSGFGHKLLNPRWKLSPREIEICNMIKSGLSTKAIADTLCVSERTIEHHRNHIRKKLALTKNRMNLVSYLQSL